VPQLPAGPRGSPPPPQETAGNNGQEAVSSDKFTESLHGSFTRGPEDSAAHTAPVSAAPAWDAAAAAGRRVRGTRAHRAPTGRKRGPVAGHTCSRTSPAQRHLVPVPALLAPAARTNRSILLLDVSVWECTGRSRSATASANTPHGGLRVSAGMRSGVRSGWRAGIRIAL
jgi:hypothetical protein